MTVVSVVPLQGGLVVHCTEHGYISPIYVGGALLVGYGALGHATAFHTPAAS